MKFIGLILTYLFLMVVVFYIHPIPKVMIGLWTILTVLFLIVVIVGVSNIRLNLFLKSFNSLKSDNNEVAITFDDGPNAKYTPQILDILAKYNAKATFFCIGSNIENNKELINRLIREGHAVGNHSYEHSAWFPFWSVSRIRTSIKKTDACLFDATDCKTSMFRPIFGVINNLLARAIKQENKKCVGWSIRTKDTCRTTEEVITLLKRKVKGNAIILLHDNHEGCTEILEQLLAHCAKHQYKPIALNI